MPKLETLGEIQRKQMLMWPCIERKNSPWTAMKKPLSECKVALVTTAGIHLRDDNPFRTDPNMPGGDTSFRVIPRSSSPLDIVQSHTSIAFDRTGINRDINVTFPMDRLEEMCEQGKIGSLSAHYYSFMGAPTEVTGLINDSAPEVAKRLMEEEVDVVLRTPT